ncbi:hypothetical protein ACNTMW_03575 [Planosporangium sp. 12N6]|uniref:hypothetical protein n=1 Tax=Planosporangium spinosum TaxID=3402278 RepID=UPI003CFA7DDA
MRTSHELTTPALSPARRVAGLTAAALAAAVLVVSVLGAWNPWRLVRLRQFFHDPSLGLLLVNLLTLAAFWALAPVHSEAAQPGRQRIRWLLTLALLPVGMAWGLLQGFFSLDTREVATSPDGTRRAAFVTHGDDRELRIWSGGWLTLRDVGRAGAPCGPNATARFVTDDLLHITSNYGDFDVRLDPATGRPLTPMGRTCSG